MKVLILSNLYPPNDIGGYEKLCFDVASELVRRNHRIAVLTSDYGGRSSSYPGQEVRRDLTLFADRANIYAPLVASEDEWHRMDDGNRKALSRAIGEFEPDSIFIWNLYFLSPSFIKALDEAGAGRNCYFLTDNWLAAFLNPRWVGDYFKNRVFSRPGLISRIREAIVSKPPPARLRGTAIFSSAFMSGYHRDAGITFDSSSVVHNGVVFPARMGAVRTDRTGLLSEGELSMLFAGRIVELKGVMDVLDALPAIAGGISPRRAKLTIMGDQTDADFVCKVRRKAENLKTAAGIEIRNPVSLEDLYGVFDMHDIYLFPSLYEPFSLTLLHAMRSGIPIVSSDAGGNTEAIVNYGTGLTFAAGDSRALARSVIRLAKDGALRKKIGENAAEESNKYTQSSMVDRIEAVLLERAKT